MKAGSSIHEVGFLIFDGEVTDDNNSILALAIAIPCGILLVVIILLGLWRWQKKKRPFPNFIVTFRNEEEDLESDNSLRPTGGCRARDQQANGS